MHKRKTGAFLTAFLATLVLGAATAFAAGMDDGAIKKAIANKEQELNTHSIPEGVYIGPVEISGMSQKEAKKAVKAYISDLGKQVVTIAVKDQNVTTTVADLGYMSKGVDATVSDAAELCTSGNVIKKYKDKVDIKTNKKIYELKTTVNDQTLNEKLEQILTPYEKDAQNATLSMDASGKIKVSADKDGLQVDLTKTASTLKKKLGSDWDGQAINTKASVTVTKAKYTKKDLSKIKFSVMGTYTTNFSLGDANRNANIKNGAKILNDIVLYPGESYDCGSHLAPWTEDHGWKEAGTYTNGTVTSGLGGGICQVSTTLYNALLRAEVDITSRFNHSLIVDYVPLSADAAIAEGAKDLAFQNNYDTPIYIHSYYTEGSLTYQVYGQDNRDKNRTIEFVSEKVSEQKQSMKTTKDPTKPVGYKEVVRYGVPGYVAKLWKITYQNGKQVKKELVNTSTYMKLDGETIVGTKKSKKK